MAPKTKSNTKKAKAARYAKLTAEERAAKTLEFKNQGNAAFQAGDFQAAVAGFGEAILVDPTNHILYSNRSAAYLSMGRADKALEDGRKCTELKPNFSKGFARLGAAHYFQDNFEQAVQSYLLGHQLEPENEQIINGLTQAQAAQRVQTMEETEGAMDEATRKLKRVEVEAAIRKQREEDARKARGVAECIGIDLGTTYSCVGVWKDNNVEIIANSEGNRTTPSYVSFSGEERLIGDAAKSQAVTNPANTVFDAKRIIGRSFKDETVKKDAVNFPFKLIEGTDEKPMIEVEYCGENRQFAAEEISAMVLVRMKETAEAYLGETIGQAVVTVPAYFNDQQRQATKDAGKIAGLDVKRIINEPTAAALAYGLDTATAEGGNGAAGGAQGQNVLIFDLGGGTFDVSILHIQNGVFEVKATGGDTHLGGEDFDNVVMKWCMEKIKEKDAKVYADLKKGNARALSRLRRAVENAKRVLSSSTSTEIEVDSLLGDFDFNVKLDRSKFEELNATLFKSCLNTVKEVMNDAECSIDDVTDIVLVGGSTRIPCLQKSLYDMFGGKIELCKSVHPDEAVAHGAAVQGFILANGGKGGGKDLAGAEQMTDLLLLDVTPLSLGIELEGKQMSVLIKRNTPIPCKKTRTYTTVDDWQTEIDVVVYEGERAHVDANNKLGSFVISGVQRARAGEPKVDVTFSLDANGILTVSAKDQITNAEATATIKAEKGRLTPEDIERMIEDAEKYRAEDEDLAVKMAYKTSLEEALFTAQSKADDTDMVELENIMDWLELDSDSATLDEMKSKGRIIEDKFGIIVS